jgi:hypothetical protein
VLAGPIKGLIGEIGSVIDNVHTSEEERSAAKAKLRALETEATAQVLAHAETLFQSQRDVLVAEIQGESWLQQAWRPITMLVFVFIILNNYVIVPYVSAFGGTVPALEIPNGMWALLNVGIGGYIASRGIEKVVKTRNGG